MLKLIVIGIRFLFILVITTGFIYIVKNNFDSYVNRSVSKKLYHVKPVLYRFPKVTIYPTMEFNSGKLLKMLKLPYYNSGILDIDQTILGLFKYDLNITGEELIRSVGWKLGEIIDRLDYEEIHQRFDKDTTKAVLWQREFLPHSCCFSFQPPPTTNRSAQLVVKVREIKDFCSWYNEYGMIYFQYNYDCPYHNEFCTDEMTCIVSKTFKMEVFFFY